MPLTYLALYTIILPWIILGGMHLVDFYENKKETIKERGESLQRFRTSKTLMVRLQNLKIAEIEKLKPDILIIDYSWDGGEKKELSRDEVENIRTLGGKRRIVLSYMSIGEAESYRFYWNWLKSLEKPMIESANKKWKNNYLVRYWEQEWHEIVYISNNSYISRILSKGFDGVFLDTADVYEYFLEKGIKDADHRMVKLIGGIVNRAKREKPDFIFVVSNVMIDTILEMVDGVAIEDHKLWDRKKGDIIAKLDKVKSLGKVVMLIEYPKSQDQIKGLFSLCKEKGYICYGGDRLLSRIGWVE